MNLRSHCLPALVAVLLPAVPAFLHAQSTSPDAAPPARQGSAAFRWEDFKVMPKANGERRDVTDLPTATIARFESHISTLKPGMESHPPHRHPREEFIIVKEGLVEVNINGRSQRAGPGSLFFFASNDLHNLKNVGDQPATYFVFNYTTAATPPASAQPAAELAPPGRLPSSVFNWDKLVATTTAKGARREVVSSPTISLAKFDCHVTTLNPGETPHAAHRHPDEELVVIKEGEMEATINGVARRAGPGGIFFFGSNDLHGMKNVGTTPATYHVIRVTTEATPTS